MLEDALPKITGEEEGKRVSASAKLSAIRSSMERPQASISLKPLPFGSHKTSDQSLPVGST